VQAGPIFARKVDFKAESFVEVRSTHKWIFNAKLLFPVRAEVRRLIKRQVRMPSIARIVPGTGGQSLDALVPKTSEAFGEIERVQATGVFVSNCPKTSN
jgi:hypothetical protein